VQDPPLPAAPGPQTTTAGSSASLRWAAANARSALPGTCTPSNPGTGEILSSRSTEPLPDGVVYVPWGSSRERVPGLRGDLPRRHLPCQPITTGFPSSQPRTGASGGPPLRDGGPRTGYERGGSPGDGIPASAPPVLRQANTQRAISVPLGPGQPQSTARRRDPVRRWFKGPGHSSSAAFQTDALRPRSCRLHAVGHRRGVTNANADFRADHSAQRHGWAGMSGRWLAVR